MAVFSLSDAYEYDVAATAATVGMFDGVHEGHRSLVRQLVGIAQSADVRPLVVTFDRHPRQVLGKIDNSFGLLCDSAERIRRLQQLGDIDIAVMPFSREMASLSACRFLVQLLVPRLHVRHLLMGYDNQFGSRTDNDFERLPLVAEQQGVVLHRDKPLLIDGKPVSSTRVRYAVCDGDMVLAERLLGCPFAVGGIVERGRHDGTRIGFPTANISLDGSGIIHPAFGVYAVEAMVEGVRWRGIANFGQAPTYGVSRPLMEVHLFGFDGSLYGQRISVALRKRLRSIALFSSPEVLRRQIERDKQDAIAFFRDEQ